MMCISVLSARYINNSVFYAKSYMLLLHDIYINLTYKIILQWRASQCNPTLRTHFIQSLINLTILVFYHMCLICYDQVGSRVR